MQPALFEFAVSIPPTWHQLLKDKSYSNSGILKYENAFDNEAMKSKVLALARDNIIKCLL